MAQQLDFGLIAPEFRRREVFMAQRERLIAHGRAVVEQYGYEVAADMLRGGPKKAASIAQALHRDPAKRNRHYMRWDDLPWFVSADPTGAFSKAILVMEKSAPPRERVVSLIAAALELHGEEGLHKIQGRARMIRAEKTIKRAAGGGGDR